MRGQLLAEALLVATDPSQIPKCRWALFILSFLLPKTWLLYLASVVIGFGAAIIWTGQGNYLTLNSDSSTMSRNSGIFWAMLQSSMFFGNLFVYFQFQGKTKIDADTRLLVFIVLTVLAGVGIIFLLVLRTSVSSDSHDSIAAVEDVPPLGPLQALKNSFALFFTKDMALLSLAFFYTGLELSFYSGVYSPSVGFTKQFGANAKQLVGLSGIFIGLGEVFGIAYLAMLCSFFLGFGDSCFNTQIYSILGGIYADDSAPAFALFKFVQSVAAAASFFYSSHVGLHAQLAILVATACVGTLSFCLVEWSTYTKDKQKNKNEMDNSCVQGSHAGLA
ncbi:hypothetical protein J437_LFUL017021 [Ladona fulva]|uniref:UNC93-like protein MFSD11 n=1 Tax=Ladona fulva TaxID=123851 RepID=A0A8K0KMW8_LADFU|nr:hypothetical protein J437_LFUL017021 [Ladona fulva]